jgi:uncharacterized protein with PIN domain
MKNFQNFVSNLSRTFVVLAIIGSIGFMGVSTSYAQDQVKKSEQKKELKKELKQEKKLIRIGLIKLKKIDKNKDGKVFQCEMHPNVLSDEPTNCPECKMKLREVNLVDAKAALIKGGFQVK